MTQEQYEKALEVKDKIRVLKREANEIAHIEICHKKYGICKQYWDDILELMWEDENYRDCMDKTFFNVLSDYKEDIQAKIESLEKEFNQL
jgi:hypothetical protein